MRAALQLSDLSLGQANSSLAKAEQLFGSTARIEIQRIRTPAGANNTTTIKHSLGRVPLAVFVMPWSSGVDVYAFDSMQRAWTASTVQVGCNLGNTDLTVMIVSKD